MSMRSVWKGHLKLGLVTCPIKVYVATSSETVSFNQLHENCGERIHHKKCCNVHGEVEQAAIERGYEYSKGRYVIVTDSDLEKIRLESTKTIGIVEFVEEDGIDPIYFGPSYYLEPDGPVAAEPYAVLREAMRDKVAIAKVALRGKEELVGVRAPFGAPLVMSVLYYADEVRDSSGLAKGAETIDPETLELAKSLVAKLTVRASLNPTVYRDEYRYELLRLIEAKAQGNEFASGTGATTPKIFSLVDAFKQSIEEERKAKEAS